MKLAVMMYSFNQLYRKGKTSVEDFINFCGALKIQGVDLLSYYWKDKKTEMREVPKLLKKNNLVLSAYAMGNNFVQEDKVKIKEEIKRVKQEIDTASELEAPSMRIFGGALPTPKENSERAKWYHDPSHGVGGGILAKGKTRKDAVDMVIEPLAECVDYAEKRGVILAIENHNIPGTSQEVKHVLSSIDSPFLKVTVDIGNFIGVGQDTQEGIRELMPYTVHVHLNDVKMKGSEPCPFGKGDIDIETILRFFAQSGYNGFLSLEEKLGGDEKKQVRKGINYAQKILSKVETS